MDKSIKRETIIKVLNYASKILAMHGSIAGDRCCQDWSGESDPYEDFTKEERQALSFNYQQYNSDGDDYDPDFDGFGDEMVLSFTLSHALKLFIESATK